MELKNLGQVIMGLMAALLSVAIILGAFFLSLAEGGKRVMVALTSTVTTTIIVVSQEPFQELLTATRTATPTPSVTASPCQPPQGWSAIIVQSGESLANLAQVYGTTTSALIAANCLPNPDILPGASLYVPAFVATSTVTSTTTRTLTPTGTKRSRPTNTKTSQSCSIPVGWVLYTIKSGDTLYSIAQMFATGVSQLQSANCMGSNTIIHVGDRIYVPNVPPRIPTKKAPKPTPKPTKTKPVMTVQPPPVYTTEPPPVSTTQPPAPPPVSTNSPATGVFIFPPLAISWRILPGFARRLFSPPTQI
jgi:LysM repeat protein